MGLAESRALDEQEEHLQPGPLGLGGGQSRQMALGPLPCSSVPCLLPQAQGSGFPGNPWFWADEGT